MTFKVHGQTLIRHLPRMVRIKKDVIPRCFTHKNKCVIYLIVGDRCRVFPLHRMYESVDTAVVIWCWTSGGLCWKFFFTFSLTMLSIHALLYWVSLITEMKYGMEQWNEKWNGTVNVHR